MARRLGLIAVVWALLVASWLGLENGSGGVVGVGKVIGLAAVPALILLVTRRRLVALAALAVATLAAASVSLHVPLTDMRPYSDRDFFGPVLARMSDGFKDMYEARTPFDPSDHPELAGLVLLAIFALLAVTALLIAARRPLWAGLVLLVGVAFPATISSTAAGSSPLRTGAFILAALLVLFFLTREGERPFRGLASALGLGAALVLVAVAASTSGAVAKDAFIAWQRWDFYNRPDNPVGVRYVWASNYSGIKFPAKATVVLRVKAPNRAVYWRATTLDEYTGVGWRETATPGPVGSPRDLTPALSDPLLPDVARDPKKWTRQEVTVEALSDTHLIGAAQPVKWSPAEGTQVQYTPGGGVVFQPTGLTPGERYTVWSYTAEVEPKVLASLPARYPQELGGFFDVLPGVRFPAFGTKNRDRLVEKLFADRPYDTLLADYKPLYRKAREIIGGVTSPYLAAVTLETWFRSSGGFRYNEQPAPLSGSAPPLVEFVLRTKEGYCQHYAGAMALMLRLLGIPARVGAGFTSGTYDDRRGEWVVTDHNAHTWTEVWFPKYGWLTFNPTPGRGVLAASYTTSSYHFPRGGPNALGVAPSVLSAILRDRLAGIDPTGSGPKAPSGAPAAATGGSGGLNIGELVLIIIAGALALALLLKALRRELRFVGRNPRQTAAACRRDLVAFLTDQRVPVPPSATLEEIGAVVERRFRATSLPFVRAVNAARFGPPQTAGDAARRARRELRTLRHDMRRQISMGGRARGALSFRSLIV